MCAYLANQGSDRVASRDNVAGGGVHGLERPSLAPLEKVAHHLLWDRLYAEIHTQTHTYRYSFVRPMHKPFVFVCLPISVWGECGEGRDEARTPVMPWMTPTVTRSLPCSRAALCRYMTAVSSPQRQEGRSQCLVIHETRLCVCVCVWVGGWVGGWSPGLRQVCVVQVWKHTHRAAGRRPPP
jgi:hypothetical protein